MSADTVLVIGSTGTQGGAVANALLERGAAVVEGDSSEKHSIEALVADADGGFCVRNVWEHGFEAPIADLQADHDVAFTRFEGYLERAW